jgi:hypothetical protein
VTEVSLVFMGVRVVPTVPQVGMHALLVFGKKERKVAWLEKEQMFVYHV